MRYLSDEWLAAAAAAIREGAKTAPSGRLTIDQHIDDLRYRIVIADRDSELVRLAGDDSPRSQADAVFAQTASTARSIARGETDAHQAFLLGRIRFEGDIDVLIEHRDTLAWLDKTLAPLMAATNFD